LVEFIRNDQGQMYLYMKTGDQINNDGGRAHPMSLLGKIRSARLHKRNPRVEAGIRRGSFRLDDDIIKPLITRNMQAIINHHREVDNAPFEIQFEGRSESFIILD